MLPTLSLALHLILENYKNFSFRLSVPVSKAIVCETSSWCAAQNIVRTMNRWDLKLCTEFDPHMSLNATNFEPCSPSRSWELYIFLFSLNWAWCQSNYVWNKRLMRRAEYCENHEELELQTLHRVWSIYEFECYKLWALHSISFLRTIYVCSASSRVLSVRIMFGNLGSTYFHEVRQPTAPQSAQKL